VAKRRRRVERGDWQTPIALARGVCAALPRADFAAVLEPTCGRGAFLAAARERWPGAALVGRELDPDHLRAAAASVPEADLAEADFFTTDWAAELAALPSPALVLGNPPWVTRAVLGALGSTNSPAREGGRQRGLDALTGKSNFDVSEWMIERLLAALGGHTLAMLCKRSVARRIVTSHPERGGEVRAIDAARWFDASVDAVLLVVRPDAAPGRWPIHGSLASTAPARRWGLVDGALTRDVDAYLRTRDLEGAGGPTWRSGIKHDCARVMELTRDADGLHSRVERGLDLEPAVVFPWLKGSDVANGRLRPRRAVVLPQRRLGDDTTALARTAPKAWAYLTRHRAALDGRKSRVYRDRPPFSVFGVGDYAFAPYKIAIAGLYPRLAFRLVGPHDDRPVLLDDTCYFLPFEARAEAEAVLRRLDAPRARAFFEARWFPDAKRPIHKGLLAALDLG